jgi:outer membrane protein OmpA-like peptidoglycan-associated protein
MVLRRSLAAALLFVSAAVLPAEAQLGGLGGRIRNRIERRVEEKADKTVDEVVNCVVGDTACQEKAKSEGKTVNEVPAPAASPTSAPAAAPAAAASASPAAGTAAGRPGEGVWVNYDFVPGTRPLFVEDFARDNVGDFPRRLELVDGNFEVAEWQGGRTLRQTTEGEIIIKLPETLPEQFTMEFEATPSYNNNWMVIKFDEKAPQDIRFRSYGDKGQGGVWGGTQQASGETAGPVQRGELYRGRIMADGKYVKVYMNDTRIANVPNANLGRSNEIRIQAYSTVESPMFLSNLRVMAGGKKLYDALAESGRVATQGIYFDTNSDRIRPESTATLKEIGTMLQEHADLKLTIEGHTDNTGNAQANLDLSQRRAAAVSAFLTSTYKIDASRLSAAGIGDKNPAAPNTTPEGRQQNRRVELVKR